MDKFVLAASHLSAVFASSAHVPTHAVPTTRRDIPLAVALSDIPEDHASNSSLFHSQETGHVLIRVVQGGLAVELVSLSYNVSPIRFVFPAAVVPNPSLSTHNGLVYLIVVTAVGTLFKIKVPCYSAVKLWHEPLPKKWCREWQIKKLSNVEPKLVHVHDALDVSIALSTGGYLRLASEDSDTSDRVQWSESEWKSSSWYTALLPVISSHQDNPGEIISMASARAPTDMPDLFTVSRDRVLRRWAIAKGCKAEIALGSTRHDDEDPSPLLDSRPQKLLQVFSAPLNLGIDVETEDSILVLVFLPTPTSPISGGSFRIYNTARYQWNLVTSFEASIDSARCRLQDFFMHCNMLYVLWEKQGQSMVETVHIPLESLSGGYRIPSPPVVWSIARLDQYSSLNQHAMDELLLRPGSLTNKFLESVLRPGLFSVVTLRAALQDYKDHYLSLPGPHPAPLLATYATLSESIAAIVGCTVALTRDPHTGVVLHNQYWNALRRDWEGFVARCTETERSARWPVCLGLAENSQVLVVERERISQSVIEDPCLQLHRLLASNDAGPEYGFLKLCWGLRTRLSEPLVRRIETGMLNILNEDYTFPLADIITEASNKVFKDDLDASLETWVDESLEDYENFDQVLTSAIDLIGTVDKGIKQEEDEIELILPDVTLEWMRALATSYFTETVEARYDLCLALTVLLFFRNEDLKQSNPAVLTEVFAVIRGVAMCHYLCRQPAGDLEGTMPSTQETATADDVISRLSSMHMSRGGKNPVPSYSLAHRLLSEERHPDGLYAAAHHFLTKLGLFTGDTPAQASRSEVSICEKLRLLGYRESARYLLTWLPRSPAVCYVFGRLWIDVGREDEAVSFLQGVSGSFGPENGLPYEDLKALEACFPNGLLHSDCDYYLHISDLFKTAGMLAQEVHFLKLALSVWPKGPGLLEISSNTWNAIIKGYSDLGLYEDAYCYLLSSPHVDQRPQYVSNLVYKMCEADALNQLLSMNFRGLVPEVESALSFKARNADPRSRPGWSQILYTWYTVRGDYRNAALTMYIRYRRLSELHGDPSMPLVLVHQQAEALSISMNALGLVESKNSFLLVPTHDGNLPPRKRRKMGNYIPKEQFVSRRTVEIVKRSDIEQEYAHLTANMELLRRDPTLMRHGEPPLTPWVTVSKLTQWGLYDLAMHTAKALSVDMAELFQRLALQCLLLSQSSESGLAEVAASDWLLTDKVSSWPGTPADRGWRYLRQCLERYDSVETDYSYNKAVLETLLANDSSPPPPWLLQTVEEHHPDHLIRSCLRYGNLEGALEHTLSMVRKSNSTWDGSTPIQSSRTWLPYTVIDAVLKATEENVSAQAQKLRHSLQSEMSSRFVRLQKQVDASSSH